MWNCLILQFGKTIISLFCSYFFYFPIKDTGISVRKRVIKILRDICLEQPDFHKITEMCVRMIRRVNDEEGIKVCFVSLNFAFVFSFFFYYFEDDMHLSHFRNW